jgi:hypothetical protein
MATPDRHQRPNQKPNESKRDRPSIKDLHEQLHGDRDKDDANPSFVKQKIHSKAHKGDSGCMPIFIGFAVMGGLFALVGSFSNSPTINKVSIPSSIPSSSESESASPLTESQLGDPENQSNRPSPTTAPNPQPTLGIGITDTSKTTFQLPGGANIRMPSDTKEYDSNEPGVKKWQGDDSKDSDLTYTLSSWEDPIASSVILEVPETGLDEFWKNKGRSDIENIFNKSQIDWSTFRAAPRKSEGKGSVYAEAYNVENGLHHFVVVAYNGQYGYSAVVKVPRDKKEEYRDIANTFFNSMNF